MISLLKIPRWNDVLTEIHKTQEKYRYCEKLNKGVKCSRTHIREIVKLLAENKLVEIIPTKKIKKIALTEKGHKVTIAILTIKSELKQF